MAPEICTKMLIRRPIAAAKRKEKGKKEWRKKIKAIQKPKDVGHFLVSKF